MHRLSQKWLRTKAGPAVACAACVVLLLASACGDSSDESEPTLTTRPGPSFNGSPSSSSTTSSTLRTTTTAPPPNSSGGDDASLTVGYLLASTGELASFSGPLIIAIQMAVEDAQAAGIQDVTLVGADTASSAEAISSAFDGLLVQSADGIVGPSSSALTTMIMSQVKNSETVLVSPSATAVTLTAATVRMRELAPSATAVTLTADEIADDRDFFFRTSPSDAYWGRVFADLVVRDGGRRTAIVYREDVFGSSLATEASDALEDNGVDVRDWIRLDPDPSVTSFSAQVDLLLAAQVDSFILIAFDREGTIFLNEYMETAEAEEAPSIRAYISEDFTEPPWEPVPADGVSALPGISSISGAAPSQESEARTAFEERYREYTSSDEFSCPDSMSAKVCEFTREPIAYTPAAYDAAVIIMLASLQAGSNDAAVFAPEINGVTRGGKKCRSYEECAQLILDGTDIDYDGISGPLDFTDDGEPDRGTYQLWSLNDLGQIQSEGQLTL